METIKVGDKVRVSKDAPRIYTPDWVDAMFDLVLKVTEVEDGNAMVKFAKRTQYITVLTAIPCKYLVKVDAEAKEAKFKKGDKVKVNLPRSIRHNAIGTVVFAYASGNAVNVDFGDDNEPIYCDCDCLELYTEPTEQTEAERKPNHTIKIPVKVDLTDNYWDAYTADLAKEVTLKIANKFNDSEQAAEYAVKVAKAVVEGLKRK